MSTLHDDGTQTCIHLTFILSAAFNDALALFVPGLELSVFLHTNTDLVLMKLQVV